MKYPLLKSHLFSAILLMIGMTELVAFPAIVTTTSTSQFIPRCVGQRTVECFTMHCSHRHDTYTFFRGRFVQCTRKLGRCHPGNDVCANPFGPGFHAPVPTVFKPPQHRH